MKNKKKIAFGAGALAIVLVAAGTFAWFSTTDKTSPNIFGMDNFDVTITEAFDKDNPIPLVPGTDVTKEVGVTNSGNVPVVVRVKLDEALELLEQDSTVAGVDRLKLEYSDRNAATDTQIPVLISDAMITAYKGGNGGYKDFTTTSYGNLTGITVLRKETKGSGQANTVYSYLAYVTEESPLDSGNHHLVQVTPSGGTATAPGSFTVKYAYNVKKQAEDGTYIVNAIHGKPGEDEKLDNYYDGTKQKKFHEDAVVLNFAENVDTTGTVSAGTVKWVLMNDGYFYYTEALNGESISAPLLKSVSIKNTAGNSLKGATYTITPAMEAVQMNWDAAKNTWKELNSSQVSSTINGSVSAADQLVYNIVNFEDHKGYHA